MEKKKFVKLFVITGIITLLPILIGLLLWNKLPEQMPIHWNINGEVDKYASKTFNVFGMPLFMLAIHCICTFATRIDPKTENISRKPIQLVLSICPILSIGLAAFTYLYVLGYNINIGAVVVVLVGVLFVIIGNYLPKCKQNYTIGIRIPWTLNDEENWNKTHRLGGKLWTVCGILMIPIAFIPDSELMFVGFTILTITMVLIPIVYSYAIYKKRND